MLPKEIAENNSIREFIVVKEGSEDRDNIVEKWQREYHDDDNEDTCEFYGQWMDVSELAKLQYQVKIARDELLKAKQERIMAQQAEDDVLPKAGPIRLKKSSRGIRGRTLW